MKNFTKQITNKTLFKPTRWLLMALMLLLGTGSAWGATVYYVDTNGWGGVNVHQWNGGTETSWCGDRVANAETYKINGFNVYKANVGENKQCIFSNNCQNKTSDLNVEDGKYYYRDKFYTLAEIEAKYGWDLRGFNDWSNPTKMVRLDGTDIVYCTKSLTKSKNYQTNTDAGFKIVIDGITWYGNSNTMTSSNNVGWTMSNANNCGITTSATDGTYTFIFDTNAKKLSVAYPSAAKFTATPFNYTNCSVVFVRFSEKLAYSKYMLVRYEGENPTITVPSNGVTYKENDELGTGVVVGVAITEAEKQVSIPNANNTKYTFVLYEYIDNPTPWYSELNENRKVTTSFTAPTVTTAEPTNINGGTATLGGKCVATGIGQAVIDYGIEWTSSVGDKTADTKVSFGTNNIGTTAFSKSITFTQSGTYTYRAYVKSNINQTACEYGYGEEKSITVSVCDRPVIVTNSATYNQSTGLVDLTYSISETGGATTHYGIQYRAEGSPFPTQGLTDADFIKIGQTDNTVTNATYTYQTVLTPGTYYFRTYANNGCPSFDYSVGMVYGEEIQVVVPKKGQSPLTLTGVETTYCTVPNGAITLSTTGGDGDGAVSYQIVNDGTTATASITTNQLSITSAGTLKLKAIKAEDTNFNPAESAEVTVTIYADIEAGIISATPTTVCQGGEVTLILKGHTADAKITWYADDAQVATGNATYTASNLQKATSYKVEVTRQDGSCDLKTKVTDAIQILVDQTSAITLSGNGAALCNGRTVDLTQLESSATGTVTWYSNETCTEVVAKPESITVNGNATYYAKAQNGVCPATAAAEYSITAKGATISRTTPAGDIHPYEVTTFTASKEATWELTANHAEGDDLSADDPVFSGKTTAYITKAAGTTTTFKGEADTGYTISATAEECTTTQTFNVVADPNNCK